MAAELSPLLHIDFYTWGARPKVARTDHPDTEKAVLATIEANKDTNIKKYIEEFKAAIAGKELSKSQKAAADKVIERAGTPNIFAARDVESAVGTLISHYIRSAPNEATAKAADDLYKTWAKDGSLKAKLAAAEKVDAAAKTGGRRGKKSRKARKTRKSGKGKKTRRH